MIGDKGGPEALLAVVADVGPRRSADIALHDKEPLLGDSREVVRGQPHLVHLLCVLVAEESLTLVEPAERILVSLWYFGTAKP